MRWIVACGQVDAALAKVQILLFFYLLSRGIVLSASLEIYVNLKEQRHIYQAHI